MAWELVTQIAHYEPVALAAAPGTPGIFALLAQLPFAVAASLEQRLVASQVAVPVLELDYSW
jgi:hypothetical protein